MGVRELRPRFLEIEGLQSFRELQTVDFDKLGENGLFGIFGPTGSGKSTILDAITLALYGNVQRASRGTQGIVNTNSSSVRVSFTFDLQRDGQRKTYKVERLYKRKKDSESSAEVKIARLFETVGGCEKIIADKPAEVTVKTEELIGLELDDFTRSVVLPQNKFQDFLLMEKAKKREMLERIFYLEEYGRRLTEKVAKNLSEVKYKLANIQGQISTLGDASEKALLEAHSRMQTAYESKDRLDAELKLLEVRFDEARKVWELVNDLDLLAGKEKVHFEKLNETESKAKQLENARKAENLKGPIDKCKQLEKDISETLKELEGLDLKLPETEKLLQETRNGHDILHSEAEKEKPKLFEQKAGFGEASILREEVSGIEIELAGMRESYTAMKEKLALKDVETARLRSELEAAEKKEGEFRLEVERLKTDTDYRGEVQSAVRIEDELGKLKAEAERCAVVSSELAAALSGLGQRMKALQDRKLEAGKELDAQKGLLLLHEKANPCDRNSIMKDMEAYHKTISTFELIKSKKAELEGTRSKWSDIRSQAGAQREMHAAALDRKSSLEAVFVEAKLEVETLSKRNERNTAYRLARNLNEGDPCPVCGATHHPEPAAAASEDSDGIEALLNHAAEKSDNAEKEYRQAEIECIKLQEQNCSLENQLLQLGSELILREQEYGGLIMLMPANMRDKELEAMEAGLLMISNDNRNRLAAIEQWEGKLEKYKKEIQRLGEAAAGLIAEETGIRSEMQIVKESLVKSEKALQEAQLGYDAKLSEYSALAAKLGIGSAQQELKRIGDNDRQVEKLQRQGDQQLEVIKAARAGIERMNEERQQLSTDFAKVETDGVHLKRQKEEKTRRLAELTGGTDIEAGIRTIDERLNELANRERELLNRVKELESLRNTQLMQKNSLESRRDIFRRDLDAEKLKLQESLKEKGFESMDAVEKAFLPRAQQNVLDVEIREYERMSRNMEAQRDILQKRLGDRSINENEWLKTSADFENKKLEKGEAVSSYEGAKNEYAVIKNNCDRWLKLDGEFKHYNNRQELLEQVQKLLKGNSFIEYVAEERLRYVAKEASETLGVLTKYRYVLELDTENGFVIRDNANGGVHRPVSSLSGGETFLTSLSLALALSKQIQLKGQSPLEFFFLDEGFGTLDSSLLDTVIDSLGRLSTGDRVIGLISHVPELRNRITRRLVVDPPEPDGKGSRVRVEKA